MRSAALACAAVLSALTSSVPVAAQAPGPVYPPGPAVALTKVADADRPIGVVVPPGAGPDAPAFVVEKGGLLRTLAGGTWGPVALDVRDRVSTDNERGLLGVAFSPVDPAHLVAVYAARSGAFVLSEFGWDGTKADAASERELLRIPHPNDDHYGGALAFTDDGLLLVSVGDGGGVGTKGGVGDRDNNAQNRNVLLGKILRLDTRADGSRPYRIPKGNPFAEGRVVEAGVVRQARPEIYAIGVRNPWRVTVDAPTSAVWVADVGQSSWEEVNRVALTALAGANFGWRQREGLHPYRGGGRPKSSVDPVFEFAHTRGRCAVIGGAVASGSRIDGLDGSFVFGDLCSGRLMALRASGSAGPSGSWTPVDLGERIAYLTSVSAGPGGRLYATSLNGGVYRLEPRP